LHRLYGRIKMGDEVVNLRCSKCQLVFLVNTFEDVRIIQAMSCSGGAGHNLNEVV